MIRLRRPSMLVIVLAALVPAAPCRSEDRVAQQQQISQIRQIVLNRRDDPAALAYLVQLTSSLAPLEGATLFGLLAHDFLAATNYDLAGSVLRQLVDQYPQQPAAADGMLTLVRLYASSEVASTQTLVSGHTLSGADLATYALHQAGQARAQNSSLAADPAFTFQCAVAARRSGRHSLAQGYLTPLKHNPRAQPWHGRAQAEAWLTTRRDEDSPLPTRRCSRAASRPQLDGKLGEPLWRSSTAAETSKATIFCFAWDDEFLYLAARCEKTPGADYPIDRRKRSYDADLSAHDHIRLRLDLDRDYATSFSLEIDHRGWTADRCWLANDWNPRWFVAAQQDDTHWNVEGAIPWTELGGSAPPASEAWAIACERVPPMSPPVEADFELLLFE